MANGNGKSIIAGALGTVPGANGPALKEFTALWNEKVGKELTAYVPHNWDAAALLMLAAEASNANTGEGIKSKILEVANAPGTEVTDVCQAMELLRKGEDINFLDVVKDGSIMSFIKNKETKLDQIKESLSSECRKGNSKDTSH